MSINSVIRRLSAKDENLVRLAIPSKARDLLRVLSSLTGEKMWQISLISACDYWVKLGHDERDLAILIGLIEGELSPAIKDIHYSLRDKHDRSQTIDEWRRSNGQEFSDKLSVSSAR